MGCDDAVFRLQQGVIGLDRLRGDHVQRGGRHFSGIQGVRQVLLHHHLSAAVIDNDNAVLHLVNVFLVDDAGVEGEQGHLQTQDGDDRVRVGGIKGKAKPDMLKLCLGYHAGYKVVTYLSFAWPDAYEKAQYAAEILKKKMQRKGMQYEDIRVDFVGQNILHHKDEILEIANSKDPVLVKITGGAKDMEVRIVNSEIGPMVVTHLLVDTGDAMGANAVNTMAEAVAPTIEKLTYGTVKLRILSNLADHRIARATATFSKEAIGGEDVVDGVVAAYAFAAADPYRAATSNKGIMNGIDPVVVATGNDWCGMEAGVHSYCARGDHYTSLTRWEKDGNGDLTGSIELPTPVGLVGGATKIHPAAQACVKILGVQTAAELAQVIVAVGLAQNFAAMRALATDGIQKGHMKLHARNLATVAGAAPEQLDAVVAKMVADKKVSVEYDKEILANM